MQCYQPLFFRRRKRKIPRNCTPAPNCRIESQLHHELSEPLDGDDDSGDQVRSRSPPLHHLPPPPPPPPSDSRRFGGGFHTHVHGQTSVIRSSSPVNDLGYHTLVASSPGPWNSSDLSDTSPRKTPSPFTHVTPRKSPRPQQWLVKDLSRPQPPPAPPTDSITALSTEALIAACKGKKWAQQGGKTSPFDRLTDDLVLRIFTFLSSSQLALCGRVCRRWHVLAWEPQLWSTVTLSGDINADRALKSITRVLGRASPPFCPTVERVILNSCPRLTDRGVQSLSRRCPELRHVELRGCSQLTDTGVLELVSKCVHLTHLDVSGCTQITCIESAPRPGSSGVGPSSGPESFGLDRNPRPQLFLQLQYLDLTDCVGLGDSGVQAIVKSCAQLSCLYLRRCVHVTDIGVKYIANYCTALRELSISDCLQVTDFGMYELARLGANLRYLSVAKCDQISDAGIKQIGRHCYKLRYLNLRGCEAVSDDSLEVLARSCSRLRALDIGKCDVTDRGLRLLAEHCPNLKKLSAKSCELITDEGVKAIAYYCRGLRQLNIQDCLITVDGYRAVKRFCRKCIIEHTNPGFF